MVAAEFFAGAIQDAEGASQRRHQAEHGPTQSCLARAVRADDPDEFRFENANEISSSAITPGKPKVAWSNRIMGWVMRGGVR